MMVSFAYMYSRFDQTGLTVLSIEIALAFTGGAISIIGVSMGLFLGRFWWRCFWLLGLFMVALVCFLKNLFSISFPRCLSVQRGDKYNNAPKE
jgi:hypothetical protein